MLSLEGSSKVKTVPPNHLVIIEALSFNLAVFGRMLWTSAMPGPAAKASRKRWGSLVPCRPSNSLGCSLGAWFFTLEGSTVSG